MAAFIMKGDGNDDYEKNFIGKQRDTTIQIVFSVVIGLSAFLAFCFIRTKWPSLYAARKRKTQEASPLPELPDSFFGWIPVLWKITEQQVLASAGLDAYVFLRFFKVAVKFLSVTLFCALVIFKPVHDAFPEKHKKGKPGNDTELFSSSSTSFRTLDLRSTPVLENWKKPIMEHISTDYLWMYLIFAYLFTALAIYLLVTETERIISIRQQYLGSKCTVTDKTIRLSGIPHYLRSEEKIKNFIEALEIGKVDSVTLCRNWRELDDKVNERTTMLRKLEESWTIHLGDLARNNGKASSSHPQTSQGPLIPGLDGDEEDPPLDSENEPMMNGRNGPAEVRSNQHPRPKTVERYGFLGLKSRVFDAIDYYERKLGLLDEDITELRKREFEPTPLAFVTMDSVAAAQMAIQAVLDPSPSTLIAKISPSPGDVVWRNTYMPRWKRMTRGWIITIAITFLTIFWSLLLVPLATALNLESIKKVWPQLAEFLRSHPFASSLVKTQLPTLISSLLFVVVPYLYDWLANQQGMTSQGDIDQSVISKNFFFLFFNYFIIFTVLGTFSNFYDFFQKLGDAVKDTTRIANLLATSLQGLLKFYTNLVILQGIGLYPFRLLEFGSVVLYPFFRMACKTPRDFIELQQPPVFSYGFFMPTVMLIFIICIVYSILRDSWTLLLAGLLYFCIGGFVTKYQLLYAMNHHQQKTGRSWIMVCNRMVVGILLFQLTITGQLALNGAFKRSVAVAPLIIATFWFSFAFRRTYEPLMKYISLGSIERRKSLQFDPATDPDGWGEQIQWRDETTDSASGADEEESQSKQRFVNPSLYRELEDVYLADDSVRATEISRSHNSPNRFESALNAAV